MLSTSAWEAIFLLVVLKIPMVYLAIVVWWAIRAEPTQGDGQEPVRALVPLAPCGWDDWKRSRPSTFGRGRGPNVRPARRRVAAPA